MEAKKEKSESKKEPKLQVAAVAVPPVLATSAGFLLNKAAIAIREMITEALAPIGLSTRELGIMKIINAEGPLSQHDLGKLHGIDRTTTVQLIDDLEKRELVVRSPNPKDRRSYSLYLTTRGKKTLAQAIRMTNRVQKEFLAPLSEDEWETMRQLLLKILQRS